MYCRYMHTYVRMSVLYVHRYIMEGTVCRVYQHGITQTAFIYVHMYAGMHVCTVYTHLLGMCSMQLCQ